MYLSSNRSFIQLQGYLLLTVGALCALSCNRFETTTDKYYDLDSLLTAQIDLLISDSTSVRKVTGLGSKRDTVYIKPDTAAQWKAELDVFFNLNVVNRYHASNTYDFKDDLRDNKSNLKIRSVTVRENLDESIKKDLRVQYLRIFYEEIPQNIRRLEARYSESNAMFSHDQHLTLMFEDLYRKPRLTGYKVEGGQKVIMGDTLSYTIEARILYPIDRNGKEKAK